MKAREETILKIKEECENVYSQKLNAFNIIYNKENSNKEKYKFNLLCTQEDQQNHCGDLYTYIPTFLKSLWDNPNIVSNLIINSDKSDLKKNIAPFIANNFYENILSSNYIQDQLLYVIGYVLKDEINNKLKTKNDIEVFLEDSPCGILLEQLKLKQDVQTYFKTVIFKIVQKLEEKHSSFEIKFDVKKIEEDFKITKEQMESEYKKSKKKHKVISENFFKRTNDEINVDENNENSNDKKLFNMKYIPALSKEEYKKLMDKYNKNKLMKDFLTSQWNLCKDKPNNFSSEDFLKKIFQSELSKEIIASYQIDFLKVIKILDELISSFLKYLYLLPYSVKCICKMIFILVKKKFPELSLAEYNAFISKFFFDKLFSPVLENPGTWALINNFIISGVTKSNLKIISFIVKKIFDLKFFSNETGFGDYTPFNWYLIDHASDIYKFFGNVIQVKLPPFIEKFLNNEINNNYEYNYFKENPEEGIFHRSICFSFNDLDAILKNMKNLKGTLLKENKNVALEKTLEKLISNDCNDEIQKIKKKVEYDMVKLYDHKKKKEIKEIKGNPILNYILITDILTNKNYNKIFNIKKESCFSLQETKDNKDKDDNNRINVAKIKNFLYKLLNNYRMLVKTDFIEGTTNTTIDILKELKKYMKISNFIIDGSIPSQWYVETLLEYLKKLPPELTNNDYSNLYKEINLGLNASIKDLDFETLSVILSNVKYCKRSAMYYLKMKQSLTDIELNEKVQKIIDTSLIEVDIEFKYTTKSKELKIEKSNKKDIKLESLVSLNEKEADDEVIKSIYCKTIKAFTKRFPNILKYKQLIEKSQKNWIDVEKDFKFTSKINNYFNIVKEHLQSKNSNISNLIGLQDFEDINSKIYDYVMEKLYDKIIPKDPDPIDNKILNQCNNFDWIEPKDFIRSNINYVFDSFLPEVISYFKEIERQKSPRQKFIYMAKIFQSITNLIRFSGGKETGADDSLEILNYALIKTKPTYIYSNYLYMNLFLGDKKYKEEGFQLTQLNAACKFLENLCPDNLNGCDWATRSTRSSTK